MKKTMYLAGLLAVSTALVASAQSTLWTTTQDFSSFAGWFGAAPAAITSSLYYSDASTVNGIGNTTAAGGAGTAGSLQLTVQSWGSPDGGTPPTTFTAAAINALSSGSSQASGFLPSSGTISFDLFAPVALTGSYAEFGFSLGYWCDPSWSTSSWTDYRSSSYTTFTGADGNTWRHYTLNYAISTGTGVGPIQAIEMPFIMNVDGADAGKLIYVDNIQVTPVPEPGTLALAAMGGAALLFFRRRLGR